MSKISVQRGIYFEISYGRTIFDPKARRELFANAQVPFLLTCLYCSGAWYGYWLIFLCEVR